MQKLIFHLSVLPLSIFLSLVFTNFYFVSYGHSRYFETLSKVIEVERKMIRGVAKIKGIEAPAEQDIQSFKDIFEPLKCFVPITISVKEQADTILYSNIPTEIERLEEPKCKRYLYDFNNPNWGKPSTSNINIGNHIIRVGEYHTPDWSKRFKRWATNPTEWFASYRNRITSLFFMFMGLFYAVLLALIWNYRSKHLSKDIKPLLENLNSRKDQK